MRVHRITHSVCEIIFKYLKLVSTLFFAYYGIKKINKADLVPFSRSLFSVVGALYVSAIFKQKDSNYIGSNFRSSNGSAKQEDSTPTTPSRRGRATLITPVDEPEKILRTPRRGKKEAKTPARKLETPKRKGANTDCDEESGVSPTKSYKSSDNTKGNILTVNMMSPSVRLAKLNLNSPRQPLSAKNSSSSPSKAKRTTLFSPQKIATVDSEDIENMLFDQQANNKHIAVDDDISFKSPVKQRAGLTTGQSPRRTLKPIASPLKANSPVKTKSPFKARQSPGKLAKSPVKGMSIDALEDLLCSPVKSKSPCPKPNRQSILTSPKNNLFDKANKAKSPLKAKAKLWKSPTKGMTMSIDALEDLLCSPVKGKSPCPKPASRQSILTSQKTNLFEKTKQVPLKINSTDDLEDMLCSPVKAAKSPRKQMVPTKSPGKPGLTEKPPARSPRKAATPMKSPRKGAANLFSSPTREAMPPPAAATSLCKADVTQVYFILSEFFSLVDRSGCEKICRKSNSYNRLKYPGLRFGPRVFSPRRIFIDI